jgi:hypothetical protein
MESLIINPTAGTPHISFDLETGIFELSGTSRPEDVTKFYKPVIEWLERLNNSVLSAKEAGPESEKIKLVFRLEYFNTASSKFILKIIRIVSSFREAGKNISVCWYYEAGDDKMKEDGEYLAEAIDLEFDFLEV